MEYKVRRIKELCDVSSSKRIFAEQYVDSGIPFYRSKEIIEKNNNNEISEPLFISKEVYDKIKSKFGVPCEGDMLLTSVGTLGIPYIVKKETFYFKDGNLTWFKNFKSDFNSNYLYYWFASKFGHNNIVSRAIGSSQGAITIDMLRKHKILVPEYGFQNKIVNILQKYDQLIENNNKRIKLLEDTAESLYKEWFVRFRFPEYKHCDFINGIPRNWEYKKFSLIYNYSRGISYSSEEIECDEGQNLINLKNIDSYGGFRRDGTKKYNGKYRENQIVKFKDLIMGVTDMTQDRRTVGAVALVPNISGVISADLIKIESKINNVFSYCLFRFGFYSKLISQFGNGANVIHLRPDSIKNQKILIPDYVLIEKFVSHVEPMINELEKLNEQNELLSKQRDALLPRLMSGKLSVEEKEVI